MRVLTVMLTSFVLVASAGAASASTTAKWRAMSDREFTLPVPETVNFLPHPVIFASPVVQVLDLPSGEMSVRQELIVKWGIHVYQVGEAEYICASKQNCEYVDFTRVDAFESCTITEVPTRNARCERPLSSSGTPSEDESPTIRDTFDSDDDRPIDEVPGFSGV